MKSRSLLERLTALVLTSGVLLSSTLGGMPAFGADHHAMVGTVAHHAPVGPLEAHNPSHGSHPSNQVPHECPCIGGACVLSVHSAPSERRTDTSVDSDDCTEGSSLGTLALHPQQAERYLQPPGTGPPTDV